MAGVVTTPDAGADEGGAENTKGAAALDDKDDDDDDEDGPVTFASRTEFVNEVNRIVKGRLERKDRKYAPIVQERDTLKAEVEQLRPLVEGKQTDDEKRTARETQLAKRLEELEAYQKTTQRNELVRRVAKDKGLPDEFIARVQGDDEDAITADVEDLVALLPKAPKVTKATKPDSPDDGKGGKGSGGGQGGDHDEKIDPRELANSIGRYGRNTPYIVK